MLGLKTETDAAWVEGAMRDLDRVLVDHAHCEMKAASNALSLVTRHPDIPEIVRALTALAREELEHFQRVLAVMDARGLGLGAPPVDEYAAELRKAALKDSGTSRPSFEKHGGLVDRLLVAALIEARSCERFKLLAAALERSGELEVSAFYTELLAAEARHHRSFVDLAVVAASGARDDVLARLDAFAQREAIIVRALAKGSPQARAAIHG